MENNKRDMAAHKKKMFARVFLLKTLCYNGNVLITRGTPDGNYITNLIFDPSGGAKYAEFGFENGYSSYCMDEEQRELHTCTTQIEAIQYHLDYINRVAMAK